MQIKEKEKNELNEFYLYFSVARVKDPSNIFSAKVSASD